MVGEDGKIEICIVELFNHQIEGIQKISKRPWHSLPAESVLDSLCYCLKAMSIKLQCCTDVFLFKPWMVRWTLGCSCHNFLNIYMYIITVQIEAQYKWLPSKFPSKIYFYNAVHRIKSWVSQVNIVWHLSGCCLHIDRLLECLYSIHISVFTQILI